MGLAKVTRGYQVTIPKDVRRIENIHIGDSVLFAIEGDRVDFMKMKGDILEKALGSWGGKSKGDSISYVRTLREEWDRRAKRVNQWK